MGQIKFGRPYPFKTFKGCLPPIVFGPFLNTLTHLLIRLNKTKSFLGNTEKTHKHSVDEQNTHRER